LEENRVKVIWGGNDFIDCVSLLGHSVVLQVVSPSPVRINFRLPTSVTTPTPVEIRDNGVIVGADHTRVFSDSPDSVAVIWKNVPILMGQQLSADTVLLHADLRPLGIAIFDDAAGLHVGSGILSGNNFTGCSIGIALG
jgi:hypothetical protein